MRNRLGPRPRDSRPVAPVAKLAEPQRSSTIAAARAAGWSGIVFAILSIVALVLVARIPGLGAPNSTYTQFYTTSEHSVLVVLGLYVVPFAGIAFLYHVSASRVVLRALGRVHSEIPHWLYLTSGVVFVCMTFAGTGVVGAVALLTVFSGAPLPPAEVARALSGAGYGLMFVYGVRAAGMFMISGTRLARATGMLPAWVAVLNYLVAVFLLVNTTFHPGVLLVFPVWTALMSVVLLARSHEAAALHPALQREPQPREPQPQAEPGATPEPQPAPLDEEYRAR